jgi:hypothetical protein
MGWSGVKNGQLLKHAADAGFDVLVTVDQNLQYEQNLTQSSIAVVLLVAPSNRLQDLLPLAEGLRDALVSTEPGTLIRVG